MKKKILWMGLSFLLVAALVLTGCPAEVVEEPVVTPVVTPVEKLPGDGLVIYFAAGGAAGQTWTDPPIRGAQLAADLWGAELIVQTKDVVDYVAQLREAIAARPDGIVIMGQAGEEAFRPEVERALDLGIAMSSFHWGIPAFEDEYGYLGFGNFWMDFVKAGIAHGKATIREAGLKAGDRVLLYDHIGPYPRIEITQGIIDQLEAKDITVDWIINPAEQILDIDYCKSVVCGYLAAHPDTDAIIFWHGIWTAEAESILRSCGVTDPDEIWVTGADVGPASIEALESGWLDLIGDGLLSMQGFLAVNQVILTILYDVPALSVELAPDHHTWESIEPLIPLIEEGIR